MPGIDWGLRRGQPVATYRERKGRALCVTSVHRVDFGRPSWGRSRVVHVLVSLRPSRRAAGRPGALPVAQGHPPVHETITVTENSLAYAGQAWPAGHSAVATAEIRTVPDRSAVQISNCPCGGGDGVGSPARIPAGVTVTPFHCWPAEVSVNSRDCPTRKAIVWPSLAAVTCTREDEAVVGVVVATVVVVGPESGALVGGDDRVGVVVVGDPETGAVVAGPDPAIGVVVVGDAPPGVERADGAVVEGALGGLPVPARVGGVESAGGADVVGAAVVAGPVPTMTLDPPPAQPAIRTPAARIPRRWRTPIR